MEIEVKVDAGIFLKFALFDTFVRQKRWRLPAAFLIIMSGFGIVCFAMQGVREQAWLLGTVLLLLGWGLPAFYVLHFLYSVKQQIKRMGLTQPQSVYTLKLSDDGVMVSNKKDKINFRWDKLYAVYDRKDCVYIYAAPNKAYILPYKQFKDDEQTFSKLAEYIRNVNKRV